MTPQPRNSNMSGDRNLDSSLTRKPNYEHFLPRCICYAKERKKSSRTMLLSEEHLRVSHDFFEFFWPNIEMSLCILIPKKLSKFFLLFLQYLGPKNTFQEIKSQQKKPTSYSFYFQKPKREKKQDLRKRVTP